MPTTLLGACLAALLATAPLALSPPPPATPRPLAPPPARLTPPLAAMLILINAERARADAGPLHADATLDRIAQARSQDMLDRHYFAHEIPGVPGVHDVSDLLDRAHVPYQSAGENLARNNDLAFEPLDRAIRATNDDLMHSPEHRANLLEPTYTTLGLGLAVERGTAILILTEVFVQP
jgi:uncharacterized protein YkwD